MGANTDISIPILSRMKRGNMKLDLSLDYHAHILPGCDHGSDGLATSLKQVEMAASAGVKTICATPHFYPHKESVESFLRRRKKTAGLLLRELPENAPLIQLGAEVLICDGMERLDGLNRLCREGTNELLLEMPFYAWPESIWDTLYLLCDLADIQIVLAHAERYPAENIEKLICESVPLQLNTLTFGFFLHGVLNLLAYLKSDYYAQYAYQRVSVDFWRGDMVSVISTGFMFTFAVALSTSILFSHCGVRKKLIALAVLLMSTFEASFFAYRTMIFIVLILVAFNLLRWLHDSSVRISRKALLIGLAALFFVAIFAIVFLNAFGIQDELLSLKIVRRLLYGDKSSRFKTWTSYLFSGDWLRYPFGGQKSEFAYHGEWVHNLWLDILNKVGLIPFVIAVIFTITSIRSAYGAAVRMKKANHNLLSNQIASLGLGALLICMPEPVVDANPYFFFAILMLLGGIKGVECSFGKEDTAESERGF